MTRADKDKRPRLQYRPTFTQYVAFRRCRYNPSMLRFDGLDPTLQAELMKRANDKEGAVPLLIVKRSRRIA